MQYKCQVAKLRLTTTVNLHLDFGHSYLVVSGTYCTRIELRRKRTSEMRANMHMHHAAAALQLLLHCLPPQALSLSTTTDDAGAVY